MVGKVVKDTEEEKGLEVEDGLRNRFLGLQLRPPMTEASTYWRTPE